MRKQRYHVVKARLRPRIYVEHAQGRASGFVVTAWTVEASKARTFGLNEALAVARRNANCMTVVAR